MPSTVDTQPALLEASSPTIEATTMNTQQAFAASSNQTRRLRQRSAAQAHNSHVSSRLDDIEHKIDTILTFLQNFGSNFVLPVCSTPAPAPCSTQTKHTNPATSPSSTNDSTGNVGTFDNRAPPALPTSPSLTTSPPSNIIEDFDQFILQLESAFVQPLAPAEVQKTLVPQLPPKSSARPVPSKTATSHTRNSPPVGSGPRPRAKPPSQRENLIAKIKSLQRRSPSINDAWHQLCDDTFGTRDPTKIATPKLAEFYQRSQTDILTHWPDY